MQSFKSSAGINNPSLIADLKELLSVVSDPKKAKTYLEEIEKEHLSLKKSHSEISILKEEADKKLSALYKKEKEIEDRAFGLFEKDKEILEYYSKLKSKEESLDARERTLADAKASFEEKAAKDLEALKLKQKLADDKHTLAELSEKSAQAVKKKFEDKLAQLKGLAS